MKCAFLAVDPSAASVAAAVRGGRDSPTRFDVEPDEFRLVARSPFAYWVTDAIRACYDSVPATESENRHVRTGVATNEDFRWLRLWWAAPTNGSFRPFSKGGEFSRFYSDPHLTVAWGNSGRQLQVSKRERFRRGELTENNSKIWNQDYYFRPGVTYSARSQRGFSARLMAPGGLFGHKGPAVFENGDDLQRLCACSAVLNSRAFLELLRLQAIFGSFEIGMIKVTPFPVLDSGSEEVLAELATRCWSVRRRLDTANEISHAFVVPAVAQVGGSRFSARVLAWAELEDNAAVELSAAQSEIDGVTLTLYGLSEMVERPIGEGGAAHASDDDNEADDGESEQHTSDSLELAADLVSWCVGVGVGRFDVRLATGERSWPAEPGPFHPLPACSPGMLTGEDGLPWRLLPAKYPLEVADVLVDDPGHRLDVTSHVRSVFDVVFGDNSDSWWSDVGEVLGAKGREIGSWLSRGFFDHHLRTYSKSRRKAPIYWPLGTTSGSYLVWLYGHRATGDSLFRVLSEVVSPKLLMERRRLSELVQEAGPNPSASQRKAIDGQETLVGELQRLVAELTALAPLWHPDLSDGIVVVLAPLWPLFAHHKLWSKELRTHWESLVAGEYDWAQLAMHVWPERVVPKCAEDRSLAIAHGLEDVFWMQDETNPDKWHPRDTPTVAVDQLIADRTSPATKAALEGAAR